METVEQTGGIISPNRCFMIGGYITFPNQKTAFINHTVNNMEKYPSYKEIDQIIKNAYYGFVEFHLISISELSQEDYRCLTADTEETQNPFPTES